MYNNKNICYQTIRLSILLVIFVPQTILGYTLLSSEQISKKIAGYDKQIKILKEKEIKNSKKIEKSKTKLTILESKYLEINKEYKNISKQKKLIESDINKIKKDRDKELSNISDGILLKNTKYSNLLESEKELSKKLTRDDNVRKAMPIRLQTIEYILGKGDRISFHQIINLYLNKKYPNWKVRYLSIDFIFEEFAPERWVWKASLARELLTGKTPERKIKRWVKECRDPVYQVIKGNSLEALSRRDIDRLISSCRTGQLISNEVLTKFILEKAAYKKSLQIAESRYTATAKLLKESKKLLSLEKDAAGIAAKRVMESEAYTGSTKYTENITGLEKKLKDTDPNDIASQRNKVREDIKSTTNFIADLKTKNNSITNKIFKVNKKNIEWKKNLKSALIYEKNSTD